MITMIDNALAKREAAPKIEILQIVANKVERIEELKKCIYLYYVCMYCTCVFTSMRWNEI